MNDIAYAAPRTIDEAVALLAEKGDAARPLAGGTDLIVQAREHRRALDLMVDIKRIPELMELAFDKKNGLRIGAAVPCYRVCEHTEIAKAYPGLVDGVSLIGGVQIQSRASIGGNLCNASPAADTIPALMVHEAICKIVGPKGTRELPVESFCIAPGKNALAKGEFLVSLKMPPPSARFGAAYLRFIPRNEMDIAVVGVGVSLTLDDKHSRVVSARIALAAVAPKPILVVDAAAELASGPLDPTRFDKVANLARAAAKPISDMRGDADYRTHLVGVLVKRALTIAVNRAKEAV